VVELWVSGLHGEGCLVLSSTATQSGLYQLACEAPVRPIYDDWLLPGPSDDAVVKDLSCKLEHWPRCRARCCSRMARAENIVGGAFAPHLLDAAASEGVTGFAPH
jgi:hypothetical protein